MRTDQTLSPHGASPRTRTLDLLFARFPGALQIPFRDSAQVLGIALQTARNKLYAGEFPIPTRKIGARRYVRLDDLANYLDGLTSRTSKQIGAPTKGERLEAARLGLTVRQLRDQRGEADGGAA